MRYLLRPSTIVKFCANIFFLMGCLYADADSLQSSPVIITKSDDQRFRVVDVKADVKTDAVQVHGRIMRSRIKFSMGQDNLIVAVIDSAGKEVASDHRPINAYYVPHHNTSGYPFAMTLPHALQQGESIQVRLERAHS
jgi:hypothetical protein